MEVDRAASDEDRIERRLREGAALAGRGRVREALALFQGLLEHWPDEPRALYNAGVMYDLLGERDRALALLARSAAVDATFAYPYFYGGRMALREGRLTEAQGAFREALARDVTLEPAYEGLAQVARCQGRALVDRETEVVFYTGGPPFHGHSWEEDGLGGSETAVIFMARTLAAQGYRVRVFCTCDRPGVYDGVQYGDLVDFHIYRHFNPLPLLISSRSLRPFKLPLKADRRVLWIHDAPNVAFLQGEHPPELPIDHILGLSRWQVRVWSAHFGIPPEKFVLTRNGVDLTWFEQPVPRERYKLVYTSRPDRGLQVLLNLWPRIRENVPEAHLHVFGYRLPGEPQGRPLTPDLNQPGVVVGGSLSKPNLARELLSARLLAYPATFEETSCMAAIEAMAAGTPVVASRLAALPETVPDGVAGRLVPGDPHTEDFRQRFAGAVVALLRNDTTWTPLSLGARERARTHYDWRIIAGEWVTHLALKPPGKKDDAPPDGF